MNYWIFICTCHDPIDEYIKSSDIYQKRMVDRFWGLGERTAHRKSLRKNDKVVFYVGYPETIFAGCALLSSSAFRTNEEQKFRFCHGIGFYQADYGVFLDEIEIWQKPVLAGKIAEELDFIKKPEFWGTYFQGGIRIITQHDFETIIQKNKSIKKY